MGPLEVFGIIVALVGVSFVVSSTQLPPKDDDVHS